MKLSESKITLPGRKQIFRERSAGKFVRDVIGLMGEPGAVGEPLLVKVMENGRRMQLPESVELCRARCGAERNALPSRLVELSKAEPGYPIELSPALMRLQAEVKRS
jgi:nicotinate phosphoribosyltransferase